MKEAVEKIVKALVGNPDAVEVSEVSDGRGVKIEVRVGEGDMGRLIGREGRNIRAFENATGVTVLIEEEPGAVVLSAFDPVRREIVREAMLRLIQDGRIHPTRIEEAVARVRKLVPPLKADRVLAGDMSALADAISTGTFLV